MFDVLITLMFDAIIIPFDILIRSIPIIFNIMTEPAMLYLVVIPQFLVISIYILLGSFLLYLDIKNPPLYQKLTIKKHTTQIENLVPNLNELIKVLSINFTLGFLFSTTLIYFVSPSPSDISQSMILEDKITIVFKVIICIMTSIIWFYYSHRLMHKSFFYKYIHSLHHKAYRPYGLVTNYCHPIEYFIVNVPTIVLGPTITSMSIPLLYFWLISGTIYTLLEHSGFKSIYFMDPTHHYKHHSLVAGNYGLTIHLDWIHDTIIRTNEQTYSSVVMKSSDRGHNIVVHEKYLNLLF